MARFTENNTEGFTAAELAELNRALDMLDAEGYANDENHVSDFLNNAWFNGASADELVAAYKRERTAAK